MQVLEEHYSKSGYPVNINMKFMVIFFFVVGAVLAAPPKPHLVDAAPPVHHKTRPAPAPVKNHSHHKRAVEDRSAAITDQHFKSDPEGNFEYNYETQNGIVAHAVGSPKPLGGNPPEIAEVIQGSYSWTSPEGKVVNVEYTADENGYRSKVHT